MVTLHKTIVQYHNQNIDINVHSLLKLSISLLRLSIFLFVSSVFIIAHWSIFMIVLTSLWFHKLTLCWCSLFIQFGIFLVLVMMNNFWWKPEHFRYCDMRLWILFQPSVLSGFLWHCCGWERLGETVFLLPGWAEVQVFHLASADIWWGEFSSLLGGGRCSDSPQGLHWILLVGRSRSASLLLPMRPPAYCGGRGGVL